MLEKIDDNLKEVIRQSWFTIDPGTYVYTRVSEVKDPTKHLIVTRDSDEITVVTDQKNLPGLGDYERNAENWKLLNIRCGNPFYCVGFLAAIASQTAKHGLDITMTSTFTNDYIMAQEQDLEKCIDLLLSLGFSQRKTRQ